MNFSPKCKQWYILLHYGKWWTFPFFQKCCTTLFATVQYYCVCCSEVYYGCAIRCKSLSCCVGGLKKNAITVGFSHNFDTAFTLNGLQLGLFRLLTQRQRSGLPCTHNEKRKSEEVPGLPTSHKKCTSTCKADND